VFKGSLIEKYICIKSLTGFEKTGKSLAIDSWRGGWKKQQNN
jgi:hypothetical protein